MYNLHHDKALLKLSEELLLHCGVQRLALHLDVPPEHRKNGSGGNVSLLSPALFPL